MSDNADAVQSGTTALMPYPDGTRRLEDGDRTGASRRHSITDLLRYATHDTYGHLLWMIMDVFLDAAATYQSRLRADDVHGRLTAAGWAYPLTTRDLEERLLYLFDHGNLYADYDYDDEAINSLDQYQRMSYIFDITPAGELVHRMLCETRDNLQRVGGLQTVLLRQIETLLAEIVSELESAAPDGDVLFTRCEELKTSFKAMTANAVVFMQQVNRMLGKRLLDVNEFAEFKDNTIAYLAGFLVDLDDLSPDIRRLTGRLAGAPADVRIRAQYRAARASGLKAIDGYDHATDWVTATQATWDGVIGWFAADQADAGMVTLSAKARQAVLGITHAVERIRETHTSPSARRQDLLSLAGMFERAAEDETHAIWRSAFGLTGTRHFSDTHSDSDLTPDDLPIRLAPRIDVVLRLHANEPSRTVRQAPKVADNRATKDFLAVEQRQRIAALMAAASTLTALGTVRLSELTVVLDRPTLRTLALLISRAQRAKPGRDGWRSTRSKDGRLRVRIRDPKPASAAIIASGLGQWTLPDYEIEISPLSHRSDR